MQIYVVPHHYDLVDRWILLQLALLYGAYAHRPKTEVARILKRFSHRLANFGAWQGRWEYSATTPWPPLKAPLKARLWVSDREDVEAHRRLLVRPLLSPAVEVSGGEVAKVNVSKDS